jgi:DNA-directed RNA polymerase specialized sigma24 family protein
MQLLAGFFVYIGMIRNARFGGDCGKNLEDNSMIVARKLMQPEVRERMTSSILETLSHLPENQKKIFIWKHYCGWSVQKPADILKCSITEVENTLRAIHLVLSQKAGALLS